jgi:hypothetical protein
MCYLIAQFIFTPLLISHPRWFVEIQNIFYQGNKRKLVPSTSEQSRQKSFFNCVACLMTSNLQSLCLNSLVDYLNLFIKPDKSTRLYEHPGSPDSSFSSKKEIYVFLRFISI